MRFFQASAHSFPFKLRPFRNRLLNTAKDRGCILCANPDLGCMRLTEVTIPAGSAAWELLDELAELQERASTLTMRHAVSVFNGNLGVATQAESELVAVSGRIAETAAELGKAWAAAKRGAGGVHGRVATC